MKEKLGKDKIHEFRRSWDIKPKPLSQNNPYHPINIDVYKTIPREKIPDTESLKDTYERVIEYYNSDIQNKLLDNKNVLISAHGNSIRALCKFLFKLDNKKISLLEIPTGNPLLINLDSKQKITECKYLDRDRAKDLLIF
jgi:2,3-bisphosphoglycerate-dependent phosphoglycerate mutase